MNGSTVCSVLPSSTGGWLLLKYLDMCLIHLCTDLCSDCHLKPWRVRSEPPEFNACLSIMEDGRVGMKGANLQNQGASRKVTMDASLV